MSELVAKPNADVIESVIVQGDLAKLSPQQRVEYYLKVCDSLELNPSTRPFDYITLNGKLTLYATRGATDQLRQSRHIGVIITSREGVDDIYIVTARAKMGDRTDESIGAVSIKGLQGEALANAMMKAETKAKRRVTLSISGLGWSDETEIETIQNAKPIAVDVETGEIVESVKLAPVAVAEPTPQPAATPAQPELQSALPADHWTKNAASVRRVMAFACGANALNESDVHDALGGKVHDFAGTEKEAIEAIKAYVAAKAGSNAA